MGTCCTNFDERSPRDTEKIRKRRNEKIVIVGGGPAGIHMYSLFCKAGWQSKNITLLEKSNRIGGKSFTIQDKGKGANDDLGIVHEMGLCYAHPDYHAIFDLIKEYDPDNEFKGVPSRGLFGTNLYDEKDPADQRHVLFSEWILAQSEELGVPKEFHWINDAITGGIAFAAAAIKYCKVWKEIFGNQTKPKRYGFPPKPKTAELLERINCSFLKFIQNEGVEALIPFFVYSQTGQGYGVLDKIPAYYGVYWNNPQLVMAPVWTTIVGHPAVLVLRKGFTSIMERMAKKHDMNIIKNAQIQSVNRYLNDAAKQTKVSYVVEKIAAIDDHPDAADDVEIKYDEEKSGTFKVIDIECDYLILACGVRKSLAFLSDATAEEQKIFSAISPHTFCSTLYESATDTDNLHERVVEFWPNVLWAASGHMGAQRNSLKCWLDHEEYDKLVKSGKLTKDRGITYQYEIREPLEDKEADSKHFKEILLGDLENWGEKEVKIIFQKVFDYHPIWSIDDIHAGYPWIVKDEMQGKNKNTFYIGSSVSFESILNVVEYNNEIFDQYLS